MRSCFLQAEHFRCQFTNYHHIIESNFKGINLCELCEKAILMKCVLSLEKSNTH